MASVEDITSDLNNSLKEIVDSQNALLRQFLSALITDQEMIDSFDIEHHMIFLSYTDFSNMSDLVKTFVKEFAPTITVSSSVPQGEVYLMKKTDVAKNIQIA